jgi:hypothetical protein
MVILAGKKAALTGGLGCPFHLSIKLVSPSRGRNVSRQCKTQGGEVISLPGGQ